MALAALRPGTTARTQANETALPQPSAPSTPATSLTQSLTQVTQPVLGPPQPIGGTGASQSAYGDLDKLTIPQEYRTVAGAYGERTQQLGGLLQGFGGVQREQLQKQYEQAKAGKQQELIGRGLTSSTALDAAMRGLDLDYQSNLRALEDQLTRQQMEYMRGITGEELQSRTLAPGARLELSAQAQRGSQFEKELAQRKLESQKGFEQRGYEFGVTSKQQAEQLKQQESQFTRSLSEEARQAGGPGRLGTRGGGGGGGSTRGVGPTQFAPMSYVPRIESDPNRPGPWQKKAGGAASGEEILNRFTTPYPPGSKEEAEFLIEQGNRSGNQDMVNAGRQSQQQQQGQQNPYYQPSAPTPSPLLQQQFQEGMRYA